MAWTNKQKGTLAAYRRYAGMPDQVYRAKLREYTGTASSTDRGLCQYQFDVYMPMMEIAAHLAEINGTAVGKKPRCIRDWYHWRKRCPARGKINTRLLWKVDRLWVRLCDHLEPTQHMAQTDGHDRYWYLREIACHAVGHYVEHLHELTTGEARSLIEALRDRLKHALKANATAA